MLVDIITTRPMISREWLTIVELDLAKRVFQIDGVDASGRVVVAKAIRRNTLLEFFASDRKSVV